MLNFIKFFLILITLIKSTSPTAITIAKSYCGMTTVCPNKSSVACAYTTSAAIKCSSGVLLTVPKTNVVAWHNAKRNTVALGKLTGYKAAVRMGKMRWSTQLEQMAKYNVMKCVFGHDTCRNTNTFPKSGQNLYSELYSGTPNTMDQVALAGVNAWYAEYVNANMSVINSYYVTSKPTGHFTALVKENSDYVGCGGLKYNDGGKIRILFACNYASTNIVTKPIYISGIAGSKCKTGKDTTYPGLCSSTEVFVH